MALSYTSVDLIQLLHPAVEKATTISSNQVYQYALGAEAIVDGKIAKLYTVPATGTGVPGLLTTIATDLTVYRILGQRMLQGATAKEDPWVNRFKETMDLLDQIASGKLLLVGDNGVVLEQRGDLFEVWSNNMDYLPTFNEDGRVNQVQDPSKIENILSNRNLT